MTGVRPIIVAICGLAMATAARAGTAPLKVAIAGAGAATAELRIDRAGHGELRIVDGRTSKGRSIALVTPDDVLPLLIDRRLSALWPALAEWAGPDLDILRERLEGESAAAFAKGKAVDQRTAYAFIDPRLAAAADRATILQATGHDAAAIALLEQVSDAFSPKNALQRLDKSTLVLTLASILLAADRADEADARLAAFEQQAEGRSEVLNVTVTRAMLQASTGHYAAALATIDRWTALYAAYRQTVVGRVSTVPGSERHATAIRACALHGLGRDDEARALLATLRGETMPASVEPNLAFRRRAAFCMGDAAALAAGLAESLDDAPLPHEIAVFLNPLDRTAINKPALTAAARAEPIFAQVAREIVRTLPPELAPASNHWRQ